MAQTYLYDDFEQGLGDWTVGEGDWNVTEADSYSPTHCLTDSPEGDYEPGYETYITLAQPLDLSAAVNPVLTFWTWFDFDGIGDAGELYVSNNGGATWYRAKFWSGGDQLSWYPQFYNMNSSVGHDDVLVRFRLDQDNDDVVGDGWYIDDLRIEERDTDTLPYPFYDDFEGGLVNWLVSGDDWDVTDEYYYSPTHALTDSPYGDYEPGVNTYITLARSLDLSAAVNPVLTVWTRYELGSDDVRLHYSNNGGATWHSPTHTFWSGYQRSWVPHFYYMNSSAGEDDVRIRIRLHQDNNDIVHDGWYVDDLRIGERDTNTLPYPFFDDFEGGLDNWLVSGDDWDVTDEDYHSPTHALTDSPYGDYEHGVDTYITLARSVDLSAAVEPVLTFWTRYDLGGDNGKLQYSNNGGATWMTAEFWNGELLYWTPQRYEMNSSAGDDDVRVRFVIDQDNNDIVHDGWYIDDVRICEAAEVGVPGGPDLVDHAVLFANSPNPFNPRTTIRYELPDPSPVTLRIFDLAGRLVDVLVEGKMAAGTHTATWTGRDTHGHSLPSGTYFYRLEADGFVETRRMTLLR